MTAGLWFQHHVLVTGTCGSGSDRIDADDPGAALTARLIHEVPVVMARREQVRAPEQYETAVHNVFRVKAMRMPLLREHISGSTADASVEPRRPERMEDSHQGAALDDTHRAEVVQRQDRLRT